MSKNLSYLIFWINSKLNMIDYNIVIDIILPYIIFFNLLSNNFEMAR